MIFYAQSVHQYFENKRYLPCKFSLFLKFPIWESVLNICQILSVWYSSLIVMFSDICYVLSWLVLKRLLALIWRVLMLFMGCLFPVWGCLLLNHLWCCLCRNDLRFWSISFLMLEFFAVIVSFYSLIIELF